MKSKQVDTNKIRILKSKPRFSEQYTAIDGEPLMVPLTRWNNDNALSGHLWLGCCDCRLRHLLAFAVYQTPDDEFWCQLRAYRDPIYKTHSDSHKKCGNMQPKMSVKKVRKAKR